MNPKCHSIGNSVRLAEQRDMTGEIAMRIRTCLAMRRASVGSLLRMTVMASAVAIGPAQAQNAATTASQGSLSGIQSVITHVRDSVQRRMRAVQLRLHHHQVSPTNPDAADPTAK
jgi:hypothetical protein